MLLRTVYHCDVHGLHLQDVMQDLFMGIRSAIPAFSRIKLLANIETTFPV